MEELIKILDIRTINYLDLKFTDNHGNFKTIKIDYPCELTSVKEENNE